VGFARRRYRADDDCGRRRGRHRRDGLGPADRALSEFPRSLNRWIGQEPGPEPRRCSRTERRLEDGRPLRTEPMMLYWAVVFLIVAIIAGIFGFGGIAATAAGIAQVLFFIFIVIFAVALIMGLAQRGPPAV
jgi:uncharacterized membrane protein YtjA (UPF0391 family)